MMEFYLCVICKDVFFIKTQAGAGFGPEPVSCFDVVEIWFSINYNGNLSGILCLVCWSLKAG